MHQRKVSPESHTMRTQSASDLFGQAKDVRLRWIPDILWILQPLFYKWDCLNSTPIAECIAGHIQTACSLLLPLCMWRFAHVCSLRNVVFCSLPAICGSSFEVFFANSFSPCYGKNQRKLFSVLRRRSHDLLRRNHKRGDLAVWYHVMLFFLLRKLWHFD